MKTVVALLLLALTPLLASWLVPQKSSWVSSAQDDKGDKTEASSRFQAGGVRHWRACMVNR